MKTHARVVVIGGGVVGCSTLYHLTKMGWNDVVMVEKDELTSGSTWHAAGNVPTYSGNLNIMKMQPYSTKLYSTLADEVDYPFNYHVTGSIRTANNRHRMDEFKHVVAMANSHGLDYEMLTPDEMKERHPFMELHNLEGGLWDPYDGDIDPSQVTQALAKGARDGGAEIHRFNPVDAIKQQPNGEWEVSTKEGVITCEILVNAAGYYGGEVAKMMGVEIPVISMSHQYLVTEGIAELENYGDNLPLLRDPDDSYYLRKERDGLILGPYEWKATAMWQDGLPDNFAYQLWDDDLERLEWYIEQAMARVPILGTVGVKNVINGPIPYAPDGNPYVGPVHGLRNAFHACSFSFGVCQGGGAGKILAEQIVEGESEWDMWSIDPRRYTDHANHHYVIKKAIELYQHEYAIGFPGESRPAGRPAKTTPVYDKLKAKRAYFTTANGWERAAWFVPEGEEMKQALSFKREEQNWYNAVAAEVKNTRENAGICDMGGFSKFFLEGEGATNWLNKMTCGNLPKVGRVRLVYMLNKQGGIVSEFTITRLAEEKYILIGASGAEWHDKDWLEAHLPDDGSLSLENKTARYGTLVLTGPKARDILSQVTRTSLSNEDFPWMSHQEIEIGMAKMLALRVSYVGELGWELHVPMEFLGGVYELICQVGEPMGLKDFGAFAMDSMRLEKGYLSWQADITKEFSPLMASLDRFVSLNKDVDFIGKEALAKEAAEGVKKRLVTFKLDNCPFDAPLEAPIHKDGELVGAAASSGYSHILGHLISYGYIRTDLAEMGTEVEFSIHGEKVKGVVTEQCLYDPEYAKIRA
ncbi:GcvT family protein [Curvivirga aplysinae]|uniref:GcvT family protein n=1 Tax=Curvivirga aplysinae TaxID=2529852 RepID=UPI0012BB5E5F|nr:FAD-dependent oxidoreductase [Curvivirga aplysinae]MTI08863.1 FAD-dependent oxidoreductase [Curvivirga aplysinae]